MTRPIELGCLVMFVCDAPGGVRIAGMPGTVVGGHNDYWNVESRLAKAEYARVHSWVRYLLPIIGGCPNKALRRIDDPDLTAEDTTSLDLSLPTEAPRVKA